ncbi:EF-P lysine aminoacylase EpmA [Desulfuromonas thiophila]|uniref:Lysyl-tRNA synthetase, class 2 n=1 Tax=Desulfuromonas thiophila TaxID=57664 RepID=A0A1G6XHF4_9BACT|nr:EF-P lysine aminoacylase EpmA [Desulfuromonas thiophila]SDD77600.1 lysyl-tRNA synthetase, class 2 [Desulfuromonas thiophila]
MTASLTRLARRQGRLHQRARILQQIRAFFITGDFLEVQTPQRIPVNAPELHIDAVASAGHYLQTSPELCMKRLLAAGYPRLFQLCQCWRSGERGRRHLPEFSLLEWYRRDADYHQLMTDCEALLRQLVPGGILHWQGHSIRLDQPFERLSLATAFERHADRSLQQALAHDRFDECYSDQVEPQLGLDRPCLLYDYPASMAALARRRPDKPALAERFELYLAGMELANGFSELTDPVEQRQRFEAEEQQRRAAGKPACPLPEPFLADLAALPTAAGIALGLDRLVMLLTDASDIAEVVAFTPEEL